MLISDLPAYNAVKVGSLYYSGNIISSRLHTFVRMICLEANIGEDLVLGRSGSATLLRNQNGYFVVLTRHSLGIPSGTVPKESDLSSVRISSADGEMLGNILTDAVIFEKQHSDEEFHDLIALHVADKEPEFLRDRHSFFPVKNFSTEERRSSCFVGCPTLAGVMNYEENELVPKHIALKTAIADCTLDSDFLSHAGYLKRYRYENRGYHVDGFSGGAIFSLMGDIGSYRMAFDGIIVRASNGFIYAVDASYVAQVLDHYA